MNDFYEGSTPYYDLSTSECNLVSLNHFKTLLTNSR